MNFDPEKPVAMFLNHAHICMIRPLTCICGWSTVFTGFWTCSSATTYLGGMSGRPTYRDPLPPLSPACGPLLHFFPSLCSCRATFRWRPQEPTKSFLKKRKCSWARAVLSLIESCLFFMRCCLRAWRSQASYRCFSIESLAHRKVSRFSQSFDGIMECRWWKTSKLSQFHIEVHYSALVFVDYWTSAQSALLRASASLRCSFYTP